PDQVDGGRRLPGAYRRDQRAAVPQPLVARGQRADDRVDQVDVAAFGREVQGGPAGRVAQRVRDRGVFGEQHLEGGSLPAQHRAVDGQILVDVRRERVGPGVEQRPQLRDVAQPGRPAPGQPTTYAEPVVAVQDRLVVRDGGVRLVV